MTRLALLSLTATLFLVAACGDSKPQPIVTDASTTVPDGSPDALPLDGEQFEASTPSFDSAPPGDAGSEDAPEGGPTFEDCPAPASGPLIASSVSAGARHSCLLRPCGEIRCWGWNGDGELGDGTNIDSERPVAVVELRGVKAVAAGGWHSCALDSNGDVYCWGYNRDGQLGSGNTTSTSRPVKAAVRGAVAIAAGGSSGSGHTCAVIQDGRVVCWGNGGFGQLGNGDDAPLAGGFSSTPVSVIGVTSATSVAAGANHTCALLASGSIQCWGSSLYGERGDGATRAPGSATPTAVAGISDAIAITAGGTHACAVLKSGAVKCWGANSVGELGIGHVSIASPTPADVVGLTESAVSVAAGGDHTCAVGASGSLFCWGFNNTGELGIPPPLRLSDVTPTVAAMPVPGVNDAVAVTAGELHTCVRLRNGVLNCWGAASVRGVESQPPVVLSP
jgi:alpha-tubulin suppressor-like RCC1 family protein